MDIFQVLWDFLNQVQGDVVIYSIFLFLYSVAAAIVLPIPVEFALFVGTTTPFWMKALILGAGKAVGSAAVFFIGFELEGPIRRWSDRWKFFGKLVRFCEWFVMKLRYVGLYILLSIPLMSDTAVLYIFSLFNKEGKELKIKLFILVNFFAGITRALVVYAFFSLLGIQLV
jgi:membrane protein YqaA with SNARE-associated domain